MNTGCKIAVGIAASTGAATVIATGTGFWLWKCRKEKLRKKFSNALLDAASTHFARGSRTLTLAIGAQGSPTTLIPLVDAQQSLNEAVNTLMKITFETGNVPEITLLNNSVRSVNSATNAINNLVENVKKQNPKPEEPASTSEQDPHDGETKL